MEILLRTNLVEALRNAAALYSDDARRTAVLEEAMRELTVALGLGGMPDRVHRLMAQVLFDLGRGAQAREEGRKALALNPHAFDDPDDKGYLQKLVLRG